MLHGPESIVSVLEHVDRTGGLGALVATPTQTVALTNALLKRRFVRWNRWKSRYDVTRSGRRIMADRQIASMPRAKRGMLRPLAIRVGVAACAAATIGFAIVAAPSLSFRMADEGSAATQSMDAGRRPQAQVVSPSPMTASVQSAPVSNIGHPHVPILAYDDEDAASVKVAAREPVVGSDPEASAPSATAKVDSKKTHKPSKPPRKMTKPRHKPSGSRSLAERPSPHWNPCSLGCVSSWN